MTKKKPTPAVIRSAKHLLEGLGYSVMKRRPDPQIGDIIRFWYADGSCDDVLITFHQTDSSGPDDVYSFGGVVVAEGTHSQLYTEYLWIDRNDWQRDEGDYELVGHVDLSGFILKHPSK